jgi:tripartite-type tricarboxylate transporter receptor subunit TctC
MAANRVMLAAALWFAVAITVHAQQYPAKTIRLIVPIPTGPAFLIGQIVSEGLRETFAQGAVAENRLGAGGSVAMETVAKSAPDGYTLLVTTPSLTINPIIRPSLKLDTLRDFAPISLVGTIPNLIAVHVSVPAKNIPELIKVARAQRAGLTYGSTEPGTSIHLASELFGLLAKVKMTHVPYKSATFAVIDLTRGDIDIVIGPKTAIAPFIPSGKLRVLAVLTPQRVAALPDVPTVVEQGMPDLVVNTWYGVVAPGGTRTEIINRLGQEIARIMKAPENRQRMAKVDIELIVNTPLEFTEFIRNDSAKWARIIRDVKLKLE